MMFDRLTERARLVMKRAKEEAARLAARMPLQSTFFLGLLQRARVSLQPPCGIWD